MSTSALSAQLERLNLRAFADARASLDRRLATPGDVAQNLGVSISGAGSGPYWMALLIAPGAVTRAALASSSSYTNGYTPYDYGPPDGLAYEPFASPLWRESFIVAPDGTDEMLAYIFFDVD